MPMTHHQDGEYVVIPDECPDCDEPLYDSGCDAPGCHGRGCQGCGWGCDWDFAEGNGRCGQAAEAEGGEERDSRVNAERVAFGLDSL